MCGICGVVQIGGTPRPVVSATVLDRMTDVMTHRGPNDRGVHLADGVGLGVRRLSIVDVQGGHQPVSSEDGTVWAVQNGELYNHVQLRRELEKSGHVFASRCDTEILPHLYERFGPSFPESLRGKFGLAVWDGERRRMVLARDRLGVKPLYYAARDDLLAFASELKSLLASGLVEPQLDYEAIEAYLTFGFFPGPATPLAGVSKLLPGHRLIADPSGVQVEQYWSYPRPQVVDENVTPREHAARILELLDESVRLRLMSDVPLGAMLSGGLDSTLIVALMARNMTEPVKTFSVGFRNSPDNELADARYVSEVYATEHHELELSLEDQSIDLAELVWHLDEPLADLSSLGFLALSELAAQHVTVALSGQGADELFGGYQKHRAVSLAERWERLPGTVRTAGTTVLQHGPARLRRAATTLAARDHVSRLLATSGQIDAALRERLFEGPLADLDGSAPRQAIARHLNGASGRPLDTLLYLDAQLALVDDMLHYFDRASMAHSLEVRVPFLDHKLVEYCAQVPSGLKVRGLTTKHLLKEAARGLVPDQIVVKRKIGFFHGAISSWFRAQTDGVIAEYLLGSDPRTADVLNRREVEHLVREHASSRGGANGRLLLAILMLEVWLSTFLPRALRDSDLGARSAR